MSVTASPAISVPSITAAPAPARRRSRPTLGRPGSRKRVVVVPPELRLADNPAAAVLRAACGDEPISRDEAARATGSSIATVNRQVSALLNAGLLRERADLTASGAVGRPRMPFEVDHEPYATVGIHIGAVVTAIVVADLRGRILGGVEVRTPSGPATESLTVIARSALAFASRWHRRRLLSVGVALGGRVDSATGSVDHPRLEWTAAPVASIVGDALGLPVSVSNHVEAMAGSELLLTPTASPVSGTSLYFYARETAGVALTIDGRVHTPNTGPGSIAHLPTGSDALCDCGRRGCLEATVSDRAVLADAVSRGAVAPGSDMAALYRAAAASGAGVSKSGVSKSGASKSGVSKSADVLLARAQVLGRTVALLADLFNPDHVVLGGQAFTAFPAGMPHVADAVESTSMLPRRDIRVTGFGNRVQQYAAAAVSLSSIYADPLESMRRAAA